MRPTTQRSTIFSLLALPVLATAAVADPANDSGRFAMSPVEGGFLRLDKQTGAVAMCAKSASEWACKPVDDQTAAGSLKPSGIEAENRALRDRVKELEDELASRRPPRLGGPPGDGPAGSQLPSEEEVDQALDYMSRVYKKIRDHIRELDKPLPPNEPPTTPPGGQPGPPPPSPPAAKGSL
jgi:hypothetical protein